MFLTFFTIYKNERKEHKVWRQKNQKSNFYKNKNVFQIDDIDVNKILISKKEPYDTKNAFKYFIGYNDDDVIRPLCVRLPQITGYAKKFNENATMPFRANNKQLLKSYNKVNGDRFWKQTCLWWWWSIQKTKIKIYADSVITNFHDKKMPKEKAPCKCLSIIMLYYVVKANKKYYPQTLLEECKYVQEKIKTENYIDEDLEKSESDSDSNDETESDIDNDEYDE